MVNNTERAASPGGTLAVDTPADSIFPNTAITFVLGHDDTWTTSTFTRCTLHNVGTGFFVDIGGATPNHGSVILRNAILSDSNANDVLIAPFGTGPNGTWTVNVDFSAVVTSGPEAIGGLGTTGFEVLGSHIVSGSPICIQTTNPLGTDFFDVQSGAYATAGPGGAALEGGGDYVGGVPTAVRDWTLF